MLSLLILDPTGQRLAAWGKAFTRAGLTVSAHADVEALLDAHAQQPADAVIAEVSGDFDDPLALCAGLRSALGRAPLILRLEGCSDAQRFAAIGAGADEVLPLSAPPAILLAAVQARIRRERLAAKAPASALDDSIPRRSGQLPRSAFLEQLALAMRAGREAGSHALLSLRLDESEVLGELLGFAAKLELERQMAERFADLLALDDAYSLWLDFGFGILARRERIRQFQDLARALCAAIVREPFLVRGEARQLTASVGIALAPADLGRGDPDAWFAAAHAAQSIARRLGGNRVDGILSVDDAEIPAERQLIIRERVKEASQGRNVDIEFQPIVPLDAGHRPMYALHTRLKDFRSPLHGLTRGEYLEAARKAGAMALIDRISLFRAFEALEAQAGQAEARLSVPIDLAAIDRTQQAWLGAEMKRRRALVPLLMLEFDLVEIRRRRGVEKALHALRAAGVGICIDTHGAPLADLRELLPLPADFLRLPVTRVAGLSPQRFAALCQPWIEAGRQLVVDGVDERRQVLLLCGLGVPYAQGNALAAAGPRMDFAFDFDPP